MLQAINDDVGDEGPAEDSAHDRRHGVDRELAPSLLVEPSGKDDHVGHGCSLDGVPMDFDDH